MDSSATVDPKTVPEVKINISENGKWPENEARPGYRRLSAFMGTFPEAAIFPRFADLNARNILYLQTELLWLEDQLGKLDKADAESGDIDRQEYSRNWRLLTCAGTAEDGSSDQWRLFLRIRTVLDQYSMISNPYNFLK